MAWIKRYSYINTKYISVASMSEPRGLVEISGWSDSDRDLKLPVKCLQGY